MFEDFSCFFLCVVCAILFDVIPNQLLSIFKRLSIFNFFSSGLSTDKLSTVNLFNVYKLPTADLN